MSKYSVLCRVRPGVRQAVANLGFVLLFGGAPVAALAQTIAVLDEPKFSNALLDCVAIANTNLQAKRNPPMGGGIIGFVVNPQGIHDEVINLLWPTGVQNFLTPADACSIVLRRDASYYVNVPIVAKFDDLKTASVDTKASVDALNTVLVNTLTKLTTFIEQQNAQEKRLLDVTEQLLELLRRSKTGAGGR